jgi:hypothetical protein
VERAAAWLDQAVKESRERPDFPDWRLHTLAEITRCFFNEYEGFGEDEEMRCASKATVRRAIAESEWPRSIQRGDLIKLWKLQGYPEDWKIRRWWRSPEEIKAAIEAARQRAYAAPQPSLKPPSELADAEAAQQPPDAESSAPVEAGNS